MKKWLIIVGVTVVALGIVGYVATGTLVYNQLTSVKPFCEDDPGEYENTPASFTAYYDLDTTPFLMTDYQDVRFPSRDDHFTIAAWWIPAQTDADVSQLPTVILVHGLSDCRRRPTILLPAGMLHRNGFNTLLIDLRDHGDSADRGRALRRWH